MIKKKLLVFIVLSMAFTTIVANDIESLFLRKAVKNYVAKNYSASVNNLEQVLVANPNSVKAKRLIIKCYYNIGISALEAGNSKSAQKNFKNILKYEPGNQEAIDGLSEAKSIQKELEKKAQISKLTTTRTTRHDSNSYSFSRQNTPPQFIYTPSSNSKTDSVQAKVITGLFNNFSTQQRLFEKQMDASSKVLENTEDTKEKYLTALLESSKRNSETMRTYMFIGGGVAIGIIILVLAFFGLIFKSVTNASDLRTVQANETLQLLLTSSSSGDKNGTPLMLANSNASELGNIATVELLENKNPLERANAVEAIAAEIIDEKDDIRFEKIKKLEELLNDENNRVRANAAKAIYEIDKEKSISTLSGMIENESKRMRASALWALGEIGTEDALEQILTLINEDDEIIRFNVKVALEKIITLNKFSLQGENRETVEKILEENKDLV